MGFFKKKDVSMDVPIEHNSASESPPQATTRSKVLQVRRTQDPGSIFVIGRSGSGKTQLIRSVCECCETSRSQNTLINREPLVPRSHRFILPNGSILQLSDTSGLDNADTSDLDIFAAIAESLRDPGRIERGITRVIYIHPAGDRLRSRTLQQNLRTILDLFVNQTERRRLTILVSPTSVQGINPQAVIQEIRSSNSGIFGEAMREGATLAVTPPDPEGFARLLRSYALQPPVLPPICVFRPDSHHPSVESFIEESLGYCDQRSTSSRILSYEKKLDDLQASVTSYRESYEQLQLRHAEQQKAQALLRQQLQEVKNDYGFLRSQVQAQDNHDQEGIAEGLANLNKDIEDIGQSIAEHITDNYVEDAFGQDPSKVSASDGKDITQLKLKLGHCDGKSSLVESSDGKSLCAEEFLDFAIRVLLCSFLSERIFRPFHPHIEPTSRELRSVQKAFDECYRDVQKYEPQYMAGKWRSLAFRSIGNIKLKSSQPRIGAETLAQAFLDNHLYPLLSAFLGRESTTFLLNENQSSRLYRLINTALEWNSKLKGEVITLGDYTQTTYPVGTDYDGKFMKELQVDSSPGPGQNRPAAILGTLALGLTCRRVLGQGQPPVRTVLEKALVATESLYA